MYMYVCVTLQLQAPSQAGKLVLFLGVKPQKVFGTLGLVKQYWLVLDLPLWKIWKSVGMIIPNIKKNKTCSKPPIKIVNQPYFQIASRA